MPIRKYNNIVYLVTIVTSFGLLSSFNIVSNAFSEAVPLMDIHTGSSSTDQSILHFFSCIHKAIHSNQHKSGLSFYFTHEPTKNEVIDCYHHAVKNNNDNNEE